MNDFINELNKLVAKAIRFLAVWVVTLGIVAAIVSCYANDVSAADPDGLFNFTSTNSDSLFGEMHMDDCIVEFVDDQTGVHYIAIYEESEYRAITPRYDSDGNIMIDN